MAIEKLYLTDTFRVWAEKFNATIDASNTATANAEEAVKKAEEALQKAEQAVNDSVKGDNITTIVNEERKVVVKNVAIGGNVNDLASYRGQIGDVVQITIKYPNFSDFNDVVESGYYFCMTGNMSASNAPSTIGGTLQVFAPNGHRYIKQIFYVYRTNVILQRFYNKDDTTAPWSKWTTVITNVDRASPNKAGIVQIDGTTITIQDGIISAKTLGTLDGTTIVNNDFNNLTTAGRYFISTVKDTTTNAPINVTADWWIDVFTYGEGSTKKIIQEARMHSTTSSSATSGVANYLARCCTGTTWGPWEYAYTQFAG